MINTKNRKDRFQHQIYRGKEAKQKRVSAVAELVDRMCVLSLTVLPFSSSPYTNKSITMDLNFIQNMYIRAIRLSTVERVCSPFAIVPSLFMLVMSLLLLCYCLLIIFIGKLHSCHDPYCVTYLFFFFSFISILVNA